MSFFSELKRRNVFRVGIAYAVAAWLVLQIVDLVLENINAPDWVMQVFMLAVAVGFPLALIVAWAFEVTPDGVKLAKNVDQDDSITRRTGQQLNRGIIVILSVAIVFLLTDRFRDELFSAPNGDTTESHQADDKGDYTAATEATNSIAVLPFRDMSAAGDQAYFGEGIAEELLNALVKVNGLHVASRTSAFAVATENLDIPAIAERLDVAHILEGSIRTSGQQVRVTAQLIDVNRDVHLWSETYDGSLDDIFQIQDEITGKITEALKLQLGSDNLSAPSKSLTDNAEAYQLYLQGRHLWRQRSASSLREAIRLFEQAVAIDPEFHRAWSNLAVAYINVATYDPSYPMQEAYDRSMNAADRALSIYPDSAEALLIKAYHHERTCNYTEAARQYETAIAADPNDPTVHHWYAILLNSAGHTAQARKHVEIAKRIDPLIAAIHGIESEIFTALGNYVQAEKSQRASASMGAFGGSLHRLGTIYLLAGETEKAKARIRQGWEGETAEQTRIRQLFLQALEDPEKQEMLEQQIGKSDGTQTNESLYAMNFLALLGSDYVFDYMSDAQCVSVIDTSVWMESFREQRGTPEFFDLMDRAGIVAYWREHGWPDDCASLDQELAECP